MECSTHHWQVSHPTSPSFPPATCDQDTHSAVAPSGTWHHTNLHLTDPQPGVDKHKKGAPPSFFSHSLVVLVHPPIPLFIPFSIQRQLPSNQRSLLTQSQTLMTGSPLYWQFDDRNSAFVYGPGWSNLTDVNAHDSSLSYTSEKTNVTIQFYGTLHSQHRYPT